MYAASNPINGTVTITVTGTPVGAGLVVETFGGCDFTTTPPALATLVSGTFTVTATNALGLCHINEFCLFLRSFRREPRYAIPMTKARRVAAKNGLYLLNVTMPAARGSFFGEVGRVR